jgi:GT2 family glycosyltransferase
MSQTALSAVSVVIVNWNTAGLLKDCLNSLYQNTKIPLQVIVVDNGSSDSSVTMLKQDFPQVTCIDTGKNLGFGKANNIGFLSCQSDLILLLNSDTIVHPAAIDKMYTKMTQRPDIDVLGCKLLNTDGSLQPSCYDFYSTAKTLVDNRLVKKLYCHLSPTAKFTCFFDHTVERQVDWICGAVMLIRSSVLEKVGGFDEDFFMYGEEVEWQKRMQKQALKIVYTPDAQITHLGGGSSGGNLKQQEWLARRQFLQKHYAAWELFVYDLKATVSLFVRKNIIKGL